MSHMVCTSHSPLMYCYARAPARWDDIERVFAERRAAVAAFDPELVIMFGSDHFNGFFLQNMPAFSVGLAAEGVDDIGGFSGTLRVPDALAAECIDYLRAHDLDPGASYRMRIDHAFTQTITRMLGGLDAVPLIPLFINCITPPFVPFRRSRMLGEAIGHWVAALGKRVLLLASGGMSHHPEHYYPVYGTGPEDVTAWQLTGGTDPKSMTEQQWLKRLDVMHRDGARMILRGERTRVDMRLNPEVDQRFLETLVNGALEEFDLWQPAQVVASAGVGFMELHTWLAATAAHVAAGGSRPVVDIYTEAEELGIALGVIHGDAVRA
ncbi:MAG: 3-carboxyethylcatechol 2,3-dioxygenase [Gammaproteobacteria bacterium]|nr:3-carboxyethylcatechol 2,3-dioxygenase [Gammaproteobacteria bacterium]